MSHIETHTLLIPEDDAAYIPVHIDDAEEPLEVEVRFHEDEEGSDDKNKPKTGMSIEGEKDRAIVTFMNWNKPFGSTLQKPISFASSEEGDEVMLMATASKSGGIYLLNIQFLKKEAGSE
ncbi:hypothetical protein [Vreelandella piezotolerans]|uniref:hypothetical protein n=1 Tax=Vreelandella piezotolerans TaxID=2609667 RepID=UPI0037B0134C